MSQIKKRYKPLYKKFLRLRVNPLSNNNNKFLKFKIQIDKQLKIVKIKNKLVKKLVKTKKFIPVSKFKKKKWEQFTNLLKKKTKFYQRLKPYTFYSNKISKFASSGNSFKRKFRNDLLAKKTFNYMYGGLLKKYLKKRMVEIYHSKTPKDHTKLFIEFFESRLDAVLYKSKFSSSIKNARQLITHKHIKINNKIEKNKSYILKQGDIISVNLNSRNIIKENFKKQFIEKPDSIMWPIPPSYLNINYNTLEIIFGNIENFNFTTSFNFKIDTNAIVTNYYRH